MAIKVFFHICAITRAYEVVERFVRSIQYSGLYDDCYQIYCYLSGEPEIMVQVAGLLRIAGSKFRIIKAAPHDNTFERLTLEDIRNHIDETDRVLYIHSKGVRCEYQGNQPLLQCIDDWADTMLYFLVRHYRRCIDKLEDHDTVGVNLGREKPHWSGNFWWVRGDYFLTLPHSIGPHYLDPELNFIFLNRPRYYEIYHMTGIQDSYRERYEPFKYIDAIPE